MAVPSESPALDKERHVKYWQRCHSAYLPPAYVSADSTRMLFAGFILSAMDVLSMPLTTKDRSAIRRWVLSLQHPDGGFCGSSSHTLPGQDAERGTANIAATFFALILLGLAAEDEEHARGAFTGVNRRKTLAWLRKLQREDGSFGQNMWEGRVEGGSDTRHSYLASSVRWMLRGECREGDATWIEDIDVNQMIAHIRNGLSYDGGLAETGQNESHGGYVYCSIASLSFLDRSPDASSQSPPSANAALDQGIADREGLINFLARRQFPYLASEEEAEDEDEENLVEAKMGELSIAEDGRCQHVGFNGRINKKADTCYCWWVAGSLSILNESSLIDVPPSRRYLLDLTQHRIGGFPKNVGAPPDLYHSYLSLAALASMEGGDPALKDFDVGLCCSKETTRKIVAAREGLLAEERGGLEKGWDGDGFWD